MIAVTGADGLIGRSVCSALREVGAVYVPVIRRRRSWSSRNAVICASAESDAWTEIAKLPICQIVHLAAAVPHAAHSPDDDASAAVTRSIDRRVYDLAQSTGARVIYMSTCGLYLRTDLSFKDEGATLLPMSPYFAAKRDGELLMSNLPRTLVFRLAAPIGPGIQPGLVVSRLLKQAQGNGCLEVWGSGQREQDFIDARDCARAVIQALSTDVHGVLNLASGQPVSMHELATAIVSVVGHGRVELSGRTDPKEGETARYKVDKAMSALAWRSVHSLRQSLKWILDSELGDTE